jgi:primosomal protein N' (replication factor Y)
MNTKLLRVAVPAPLHRLFDYLPPKQATPQAYLPGMRVRVPFGRTHKIGVIIELAEQSDVPVEKLRTIAEILDEQPLLSPQDLAFLQWVAGYYHHPIGEVVVAALPLRLRKQAQALPLTTKVCCLGMPTPGVHELNHQQKTVIDAVQAKQGQFATFLLEGVTGSGKTEVYLQLTQQALQQNHSVMLLVPEISLTPQLQASFDQRLGDNIAVMHSNLSANQRELAWQRVRLGSARVVLGTRSLVFNPVDKLGLIVVDEEHDTSFKQQDGLRYSARDLAVIRAQQSSCPVVLGSATPSLESLRNAQAGRYQHLRMPDRAGGAKAPQIDLLDIRDQPLQGGIAPVLLQAVKDTLAAGTQAMLFINRRGYAPVLACYGCGWLSDCHRCDARQTVHRKAKLLWCHHCGAQRQLPVSCPSCGAVDLHPLGQGTEQIEEVLKQHFPDVPILRIDRDATARKGSLDKVLGKIHSLDSALLVGTQMLAKGHHFPRVTLVGVLDVDGGLFSADFRSAERMAQLVMQVAGRAGRGEQAGKVLVQTRYPENALLQTLVKAGYAAFAQAALTERQAAGYPPFAYQALLRAEASKVQPPEQFLQQVSRLLVQNKRVQDIEHWGPVPAPMARRVGKYRAHLLLQSNKREALHTALNLLQQQIPELSEARRVRWSLDVDPLDVY